MLWLVSLLSKRFGAWFDFSADLVQYRFNPFLFQCQGEVAFYGIKTVKIYAREIVASSGSKIIVSTPNWNLEFSNAVATKSSGDGTDGQDGKDGKDGPQGQYYKTVVTCC